MSLVPCTTLWGDAVLFEGDPGLSEHRDVVYTPFRAHGSWGVFDKSGQIVESTVNFRGPERHLSAQSIIADFNPDHIRSYAPDDVYIYGGRINLHYGHFLIDVLPRFWFHLSRPDRRTRILCHESNLPESWFNLPFAAAIFHELGLRPEDFVVLNERVRINRLIVPQTSLREQAYVHQIYGLLCRKIGAVLLRGMAVETAGPVYLSKTQLTSGVGRIDNEQQIVDVLAGRGVEIVHPQNLSFTDQIQLFAQRRTIMGSVGSAFHTSVFAPPRSRLVGLSPIPSINSNFAMIDKVNGNEAKYFHAEGTAVVAGNQSFLTDFLVPDPEQVAGELLEQASLG